MIITYDILLLLKKTSHRFTPRCNEDKNNLAVAIATSGRTL